MLIDLHCHTRERSSCSIASEEALIRRAIAGGLGGVAFTDHNRLPPPGRLAELNKKFSPFRIFTGIEINVLTTAGWQDFLAIGVDDPILEYEDWTCASLVKWVRRNNGWIALAHPFRYRPDMPREIIDNPPDALEMYSTNIDPKLSSRILATAKEWGCQVIGTSDAHTLDEVGYRTISLSQPVASDAELIVQLKKGAFQVGPGNP
jgi:histidinol phosphatase-like PHP family hydrolase